MVSLKLSPAESTLTSPDGNYRWLDIADQEYSPAFRETFKYADASVTVEYLKTADTFRGKLSAKNLKPNFAYQVKLVGEPDTLSSRML